MLYDTDNLGQFIDEGEDSPRPPVNEEHALDGLREIRSLEAQNVAIDAEIKELKAKKSGNNIRIGKIKLHVLQAFLSLTKQDNHKTHLGTFYKIAGGQESLAVDTDKVPLWPKEIVKDGEVVTLSYKVSKTTLKNKYGDKLADLEGVSVALSEPTVGVRK